MYQPAHLDGRTVVVLRSAGRGYRIVESGYLSFDGETSLVGEETQRLFSDAEMDSLKLVAPGNQIPACQGFDFFLIAEEFSQSGPLHRRLDRLFRSESQQTWWLLKIAGAGLVGLAIAIRVALMNRDRLAIAAHVATLVIVPTAAIGCAVALMRADSVRRRLRRGESVGLLSRILFGAGIWSLLIWIVGALLMGFPLAVWLGALTADRPAG